MFRLIALGMFAVAAWAQSALNPYDLARAIDSRDPNWTSHWKALGVTDRLSFCNDTPEKRTLQSLLDRKR